MLSTVWIRSIYRLFGVIHTPTPLLSPLSCLRKTTRAPIATRPAARPPALTTDGTVHVQHQHQGCLNDPPPEFPASIPPCKRLIKMFERQQ